MIECKRKGMLLEISAPRVYRLFRLDKIISVYSFDLETIPYVGFAIEGDEEPWSIDAESIDEAFNIAKHVGDLINEVVLTPTLNIKASDFIDTGST